MFEGPDLRGSSINITLKTFPRSSRGAPIAANVRKCQTFLLLLLEKLVAWLEKNRCVQLEEIYGAPHTREP